MIEKKLKVCIVTGLFPPDIGGPPTHVEKLANDLHKKGHHVKIVTFGQKRKKYPYSIFTVSRKYPFVVKIFITAWKIMSKCKDCDVMFSYDPWSCGIPAYIVRKFTGKKYLMKFAGDTVWEISRSSGWVDDRIEDFQKEKYSVKIEFMKKVLRKIIREADQIITPSNYLKKLLVDKKGIEPSKINVAFNALEPNDLKSPSTKIAAKKRLKIDFPYILTSGRLVPWKGFDRVIQIMPELLKINRKIRLIILGDGPEKDNLQRIAEEKGVSENVILKGRVSHELVPTYLKGAELYVLNTDYEGLSHAILEAMIVGCPVVSTTAGGNPETIGNNINGLLVEFHNDRALEGAIRKVLTNKKLADKFIKSSQEKIKREFNWNNLFEKTIELLRNIS